MSGLFVTFEGADGVGKSTILKQVASLLKKECKKEIFVTAEPTSNVIGDSVKKLILKKPKLSKEYHPYLFLADRLLHLQNEIIPAVKAGKLVLCDRYHDSTIAYQSKTNAQRDFFYNMYNEILLLPDKTIWLNTEISLLKDRLASRKQKNVFDQQSKQFFLEVQKGYRWLFEKEQNRIVCIKNNERMKQAVQEVKTAIIDLIDNRELLDNRRKK